MYGELTRSDDGGRLGAHRGAMELLTRSTTNPSGSRPHPNPPTARPVGAAKVHGNGDTAVRALDGVSVDFAAGGFTAIKGTSSSASHG